MPARAANPVKPLNVVLLGDSYSSGTGAGSYAPGPKDCFRSSTNWAERYVKALDRKRFAPKLTNRACHGALVGDLNSAQDRDTFTFKSGSCPPPPQGDKNPDRIGESFVHTGTNWLGEAQCKRTLTAQINAVSKDTDLVFFTIGGNDLNFRLVVEKCFGPGILSGRSAANCGEAVETANAEMRASGPGSYRERLKSALTALRSKGRDDTKIVFVSYPHIERDANYVLEDSPDDYPAGQLVRESAERFDALQLEMLRAVYPDAIKASSCVPSSPSCLLGSRAIYLDTVKNEFKGREPDGRCLHVNHGRWIHEVVKCREGPSMEAESYHPNPEGQEAIKDLLIKFDDFGAGTLNNLKGASIDLVLAIDTTESMRDDIDAVQSYASQLVDKLVAEAKSFRVGMVTYRDFPDRTLFHEDYPSRVDLEFSTDKEAIQAAIDGLTLGHGGDLPESVYSGLQAAIEFPWRIGVKKVIIQLGDAPPLDDPEPYTGLTETAIVAAARAVDPAEVYVVDVSSTGDAGATGALTRIASATGGRVIASTSPDDVAEALGMIVGEATSAPSAWAGGPYIAMVGRPVTFDAGGSFDDEGIVSYEWDVNGDGAYDTTGDSEHSYTYDDEYEGVIGVRVTDSRGLKAEATAGILVSVDGDLEPTATDNCPAVSNPGQDDFDADGIGDECDSTPGFPPIEEPLVTTPEPEGRDEPREPDRSEGSKLGPWRVIAIGIGSMVIIGAIGVGLLSMSRKPRPVVGHFCDQCGQPLEDSPFCDACGTQVGSV